MRSSIDIRDIPKFLTYHNPQKISLSKYYNSSIPFIFPSVLNLATEIDCNVWNVHLLKITVISKLAVNFINLLIFILGKKQ